MPARKAELRLLTAVLAVSALLAGCGDSGVSGTIQADAGSALLAELESAQNALTNGECADAQAAVEQFKTTVNGLPAEPTGEAKQALQNMGDSMESLLLQNPDQCGATGPSGDRPKDEDGDEDTETTSSTTSSTTTSSTTTTSTRQGGGSGGGGGGGHSGGSGSGGTGGTGSGGTTSTTTTTTTTTGG